MKDIQLKGESELIDKSLLHDDVQPTPKPKIKVNYVCDYFAGAAGVHPWTVWNLANKIRKALPEKLEEGT